MLLVLDNIEVVYSNIVLALTDVSMRLDAGKIVVLLGNNGSGKSTTLKSVSGVLHIEDGELTKGKIELEGRRIDNLKPENAAALGICHVTQGRPVFPQLSVAENLLMGAYLRKDGEVKADLQAVYERFPRLVGLRKKSAGYLSGGEQQMLVIGRALMARPRLMLLDEPSLGLSPAMVDEMFAILKAINTERHTAMLIAEQNVGAALSIADYGYVLQAGKMIAEGKATILRDDPTVKKSYLGTGRDSSYYRLKSAGFRQGQG